MRKSNLESADLLKEIIQSCASDDIPSDELDSFIKFLANYSNEGNQNSDKTGAEVIFLTTFFTDELQQDFPLIETDFILHCRDKLPQFGRKAISLVHFLNCTNVIDNHQERVLASILCGAKSGDTYCVELLKSMYKVYYKKEYSQLKRYPELTCRSLGDLCDDDYYRYGKTSMDTARLARILTLAPFFQIPCNSDCDIYFASLEKDMEAYMEDSSDTDPIDIAPEDIANTVKQFGDVLEMLSDMQADDKLTNSLVLAQEMLKIGGLPPENLGLCGMGTYNAYNLALITKLFEPQEYNSEQLETYMMICDLARYLSVTLGFINAQTKEYLFQSIPQENDLKVLQALKKISFSDCATVKKEENSVKLKNPSPMDSFSKDNLEMAELKDRLRDAVSVGSHFQEEYKKEKQLRESLEKKLQEHEAMRQELAALREFVYTNTEETVSTPNIPIAEMKKAIASKRITIVGGNENWVKKIHQEFPDWKFVSASVSNTVDNMSILKAERVILFTDTLGHSNYYKFMQTIQAHNIPFVFLHGVNIERNIIQIYEEIFEKK